MNFLGCSNAVQNAPLGRKNIESGVLDAINVNTADAKELGKLPRIGEETAKNIVEHRERFGRFRRKEQLILVKGLSDKKYRELQNLVKVE